VEEAGEVRRSSHRMLDFDGRESRSEIEPQKPVTIARSLAIGNPADVFTRLAAITKSGGGRRTF
jgi:hypothetical protein